MAGFLPSIVVRAMCKASRGEVGTVSSPTAGAHFASGMRKVGGKEADPRMIVFNSNFVCNPVRFVRETLQGLGRRCILHRQNSLVRVVPLLQALFDPTYALFPSLSPTFLPFFILLQVWGLIA